MTNQSYSWAYVNAVTGVSRSCSFESLVARQQYCVSSTPNDNSYRMLSCRAYNFAVIGSWFDGRKSCSNLASSNEGRTKKETDSIIHHQRWTPVQIMYIGHKDKTSTFDCKSVIFTCFCARRMLINVFDSGALVFETVQRRPVQSLSVSEASGLSCVGF